MHETWCMCMIICDAERSVKLSVVDNPTARREGVKFKPTNVQCASNIKSGENDQN